MADEAEPVASNRSDEHPAEADRSARSMLPTPPPARLALVIGALGVVFGDLGTSPLYTMQECLSGPHGAQATRENVFGIVSLIFWSITLVVTIKYLVFLMRADNHGEGGIIALLALVPERLRASAGGRVGLVPLLVIAGAALLFGDGIITPAISVLSAMEGLEVATSSLKSVVVPATVVILVGLFAIQSRGTGVLGALFGPVMLVWFSTIAVLGVIQIVRSPEILGALSPHHGVKFFAAHGFHGVRVLGGVVLAVTGGEALYADMGHFGRRPIQRAWIFMVMPSLILCYLGQGALITATPSAIKNTFFAMTPGGVWVYPFVALAALATIIASQALITGVFSLTHQAMRLGFFPRLTSLHTSKDSHGQIYVPLMNWFLAVSCIALVVIFQHSSKLAAAFGLAVSGTMLITAFVYYAVTRYTWGWSAPKALALLIFFLSFDIPFVIANVFKFFDGGYLPFCVGVFFVIIMALWRRGRSLLGEHLTRLGQPLTELIAEIETRVIARVPGTAVVLTSRADVVPPPLRRMVNRFKVVHERTVIVCVTSESVPFVPVTERVETEALGKGFYRVILRYGFMQTPNVPVALELVPELETPASEIVYVVGRETFVAGATGAMGRITESIFALLSRNALSASDAFGIPPTQVVEVGAQIDL